MSTSDDVIPHAGLIRAVLDGKTVQNYWQGKWQDLKPATRAVQFLLQWNPDDGPVRVKPEAIVRYCPLLQMPARSLVLGPGRVTKDAASSRDFFRPGDWVESDKLVGVLRVEFDPDTLAVIKAETEKVS